MVEKDRECKSDECSLLVHVENLVVIKALELTNHFNLKNTCEKNQRKMVTKHVIPLSPLMSFPFVLLPPLPLLLMIYMYKYF